MHTRGLLSKRGISPTPLRKTITVIILITIIIIIVIVIDRYLSVIISHLTMQQPLVIQTKVIYMDDFI